MTDQTFKPMHGFVGDTAIGDVGWVWWMDEWVPARILEDNEDVFCVCLMPDGSEWLKIGPSEDDPVSRLPWFEIHTPPYEIGGDDAVVTSSVTYRDGCGSWTYSWRMPLEGSYEVSQSIYQNAKSLIDGQKAGNGPSSQS